MDCAICLNKINEEPLQVKEMMFGTGRAYQFRRERLGLGVRSLSPEHSLEKAVDYERRWLA